MALPANTQPHPSLSATWGSASPSLVFSLLLPSRSLMTQNESIPRVQTLFYHWLSSMEETENNLMLSLVARFKDSTPSSQEPFPYKQKPYEDFQRSKVISFLRNLAMPIGELSLFKVSLICLVQFMLFPSEEELIEIAGIVELTTNSTIY